MTKGEIDDGAGLLWSTAGPLEIVLPPLPNFLFQRDPSSWIFNGVTLNPMTKRARRPELLVPQAAVIQPRRSSRCKAGESEP